MVHHRIVHVAHYISQLRDSMVKPGYWTGYLYADLKIRNVICQIFFSFIEQRVAVDILIKDDEDGFRV
jgi:hypothetical protein